MSNYTSSGNDFDVFRLNLYKKVTALSNNLALFPRFRGDPEYDINSLISKPNIIAKKPPKATKWFLPPLPIFSPAFKEEFTCCIAQEKSDGWERCTRPSSHRILNDLLEDLASDKKLPLAIDEQASHRSICIFHWRVIKYSPIDRLLPITTYIRFEKEESQMERMEMDTDFDSFLDLLAVQKDIKLAKKGKAQQDEKDLNPEHDSENFASSQTLKDDDDQVSSGSSESGDSSSTESSVDSDIIVKNDRYVGATTSNYRPPENESTKLLRILEKQSRVKQKSDGERLYLNEMAVARGMGLHYHNRKGELVLSLHPRKKEPMKRAKVRGSKQSSDKAGSSTTTPVKGAVRSYVGESLLGGASSSAAPQDDDELSDAFEIEGSEEPKAKQFRRGSHKIEVVENVFEYKPENIANIFRPRRMYSKSLPPLEFPCSDSDSDDDSTRGAKTDPYYCSTDNYSDNDEDDDDSDSDCDSSFADSDDSESSVLEEQKIDDLLTFMTRRKTDESRGPEFDGCEEATFTGLSSSTLRKYRKYFNIPAKINNGRETINPKLEKHLYSLPNNMRDSIISFLHATRCTDTGSSIDGDST